MTSGREPGPAERGIRGLLRENEELRAENLALRELYHAHAGARRQAARDRNQLDEIVGSRAWALVRALRRLAALMGFSRLFRAGETMRASADATPPSPRARAGRSSPRPRGGRHAAPKRVAKVRSRSLPGARSRPRVSVIVPNYNHAAYLEDRLRSILDQTYRPHEILFLDDASSDDSVAVARRVAAGSPVSFRFVLNDSNSGSTFRQWLKGIDLAVGDLVWIAESDDTCRPELLERLVPSFRDPEVMLAYCQSAMIGPDGRTFAADYLSTTDDLSPVHWRHPYRVPGYEEVELALSQRNTIPNASAVVFRRPVEIPEREDLLRLRLAGDWLFYAMRIRRGKIAYIPEVLNGHRHHDRTVRTGFERAAELFEEQWLVKTRIIEGFRVTDRAIAASVARSLDEYARRMRALGPRTPATENPLLGPYVDRIRAALDTRRRSRGEARVLVVVSGVSGGREQRAEIRLANSLAARCRVWLCNARPGILEPRAALRIDPRVLFLEGTPGIAPWSGDDDSPLDAGAVDTPSARRIELIRDLLAFHRIDAVHASGDAAHRLIAAVGLPPGVRVSTAPRDDDQAGCLSRRQAERTDRASCRAGRGA